MYMNFFIFFNIFLKKELYYLYEYDILNIKLFYFVDCSNLCFVIFYIVFWLVEKFCGEFVGLFFWILKRVVNKLRRLI